MAGWRWRSRHSEQMDPSRLPDHPVRTAQPAPSGCPFLRGDTAWMVNRARPQHGALEACFRKEILSMSSWSLWDPLSLQLPPQFWDTQESRTMAPPTPRTLLLHRLLSSKSCRSLPLISISLRSPQEHTNPQPDLLSESAYLRHKYFFATAKNVLKYFR